MSKNLSELSGRKGLRENLFEELGIAATATGTPSIEKLEQLADEFVMGKANVYGAVSFYDFLRPAIPSDCYFKPPGLKLNAQTQAYSSSQ